MPKGETPTRGLLQVPRNEESAFKSGHIPGARHLPRGQLELRVNEEIPVRPFGS